MYNNSYNISAKVTTIYEHVKYRFDNVILYRVITYKKSVKNLTGILIMS